MCSHIGKNERGQERETNLASVGMSGEDQGDLLSDGMVGEIGLVRQQDEGFLVRVPAGGESGGRGRAVPQSILDAGEPQAPAVAFQGHRTVCQYGNAMGDQSVGDRVGADQDVVVAQDRIAQRAFDVAKHFGAVVAHACGKVPRQRIGADEVSGQHDEIGSQLRLPCGRRPPEKMLRCIPGNESR